MLQLQIGLGPNMISSPGRSPIWSRLITSAGVALDHVGLGGDLGSPGLRRWAGGVRSLVILTRVQAELALLGVTS